MGNEHQYWSIVLFTFWISCWFLASPSPDISTPQHLPSPLPDKNHIQLSHHCDCFQVNWVNLLQIYLMQGGTKKCRQIDVAGQWNYVLEGKGLEACSIQYFNLLIHHIHTRNTWNEWEKTIMHFHCSLVEDTLVPD